LSPAEQPTVSSNEHGWLVALMVTALPIPIGWVTAFLAFWNARLVEPCFGR
jgi:hypothetical protein